MHSISTFPVFTPLDLSHKGVLREIANNFPSYSDFNFVSLFTWDTEGEAKVSDLNDNLVIQFTDYIDRSIFYSLMGENQLEDSIKAIINLAEKNGEKAELLLVPHSTATKVASGEFSIEEDEDNHDYILSVNDLVEFRTNKYRGKKNLYNRFMRAYATQTETKELDIHDNAVRDEILKLLDEWQISRTKGASEVENETKAIKRCLQHSNELGVRAFGTYIDNKLAAFSIFEILPKQVAMLHFEKANIEYVGVFEHLKHNLAKHLATMDIKTINYEQDLGMEGLRKNKQSLHPVEYLKKYRIKLKTN